MRLLHTSDWHLGKRLFDKERYDVFENFLTWLLSTIRKERVDTLPAIFLTPQFRRTKALGSITIFYLIFPAAAADML